MNRIAGSGPANRRSSVSTWIGVPGPAAEIPGADAGALDKGLSRPAGQRVWQDGYARPVPEGAGHGPLELRQRFNGEDAGAPRRGDEGKQAFRSPAIEDDIARGEDVILLEIAVPIAAVEDFDENFLQGSKGEDFRPKTAARPGRAGALQGNPQRLPSVR